MKGQKQRILKFKYKFNCNRTHPWNELAQWLQKLSVGTFWQICLFYNNYSFSAIDRNFISQYHLSVCRVAIVNWCLMPDVHTLCLMSQYMCSILPWMVAAHVEKFVMVELYAMVLRCRFDISARCTKFAKTCMWLNLNLLWVFISRYLEMSNLEIMGSAIDFWKKNTARFPSVAALALTVLIVPATSAPVERIFSTGGILMRPHRASLSPETLSQLIFIKSNKWLL